MKPFKLGWVVILGLFLWGCVPVVTSEGSQPVTAENQGQMLPIRATARMGGETIQLEVAETPEQQALGLMFRDRLPDDRGMLFSFDPPRPVGFWMKNVSIYLDMVFLQDGEIRYIAANVPPCNKPASQCPAYGPPEAIDRVIELRGGRAEELELKIGDRVTIEFLN
ncbi:DUF192 domain-containing protein [Spirulina sp. 06S082]|uniref:DUF192 domain-containing protein n=1 Tax=Spirulina sp. 06S082 TaxID=3110248 RepID=UPI002B20C947|nr:DUF192 domain-containing protein [Spirulina sp. 06S082]MEA5468464.1 DUF192 domain-containing protein [Spirulina sp. 06S082]